MPGTDRESAVEIVTAAMNAFARGDLDAMASYVHPDADIEMVGLGGTRVHGVDGLRGALDVAGTRMHRPVMTSVEAVGEDGAMMIGRVRYGDETGGVWDSPAVWLSIVHDGKIWRTRAFASTDEARAAYPDLAAS
jgi:ketosteroid isomerase-like protein